jgi:PEP-CTERM motif-containing protein
MPLTYMYDQCNKNLTKSIPGAFVTKKPLRHFLVASIALVWAASLAQADIIVTPTFDSSDQTTDGTDYEGNFFTAGPDDITIGTFDFTIPVGDQIAGATISGTFGDVNFSTSALAELLVDGGTIPVGACASFTDPCFAGNIAGTPVPWSYTFTSAQLADLAGGSLDFTAVQNSFGSVIVGTPTLDIQTVPEPTSIFTLAGGLLAFAAWRRRK